MLRKRKDGRMASSKTLLSAHWICLRAAASIIALLFPLYLYSEGFSEAQLGSLFAIGTALSIALSILLFVHSDIIGRKFYLIVFGLFIVLASLIAAVLPPLFFLGLLVILFYAAAYRSPWTFGKIFVIERFGRTMGRSYGIFGASITIGFAAGSFLAGAFVDSFGFRLSFLICCLIGLISLLPVAFLSEKKVRLPRFSFKPKLTKTLTGFIFHRLIFAAGLSSLLTFALPLYLKNVLLLPYILVGIIIMLKTAGSVLGWSLGRISDKYDYKAICCGGIFVAGLFFLSLSFLKYLPLICLMLFLAEFAYCIASTALPYFYREVSTQLGRDISIIESIGVTLGASVGPWISGLVISFAGYPQIFIFGSSLMLGSALILYAIFK